ncbi:hypothetical protein DXG01_008576 [Tephrocybe rancida]|nr:hypothetical protein DXG01_008576 [Tephrocybe rancida]
MASSNTPLASPQAPRFPVSPIPANPLGEGRHIRTAAALVIGDEILNGKTLDRNSNFFAQYCFEHGIQLKKIEVIPDDEQEIIEASRRMVKTYDFVITTGGIGPTHDDITYGSLAKSFEQSLAHHTETLRRMEALSKNRRLFSHANEQQREAARRMALFPQDAEVIYIGEDIWVVGVPFIVLPNGVARGETWWASLCIPGHSVALSTDANGPDPIPPSTTEERTTTTDTSLHRDRLQKRVQVGSYPVIGKGVFVSLIGSDPCGEKEGGKPLFLADIAREVEKEVDGRVVSDEEVAEKKGVYSGPQKAKKVQQTFLRNEPYIVLNHFSGHADADTLYVPPHWHETHDEIIRVVKGKMEIRLGSSVREYTQEDGDVVISKGVVHSLRTFKGVECTFYERTDPMDDEKEIFFRNMLANISSNSRGPGLLDAMVAFYHGDAYPAFPGHVVWLEKLVSLTLTDWGN